MKKIARIGLVLLSLSAPFAFAGENIWSVKDAPQGDSRSSWAG